MVGVFVFRIDKYI